MMRLEDVPRPPLDAPRQRYKGSSVPHSMIDVGNERWRVSDDGEILVYIEYDDKRKWRRRYTKPGLPF